MLNDATGLKKIYLAAGYTDLRRGMDGLATIIRFRFQLDPYEQRCLQLATFRRRGVGNIPGTVYDADARA